MGWEGESGRWGKGWTEKGCWSEQQVGMGLTGHESEVELVPKHWESSSLYFRSWQTNPQAKSSLLPDFANTCYLLLSVAIFLL